MAQHPDQRPSLSSSPPGIEAELRSQAAVCTSRETGAISVRNGRSGGRTDW